jgi:3-phenylpropionate/trans-cinnamate dioxygenase ferredoxin component
LPDIRLCSPTEVEPGSVRRFDVDGYRLALARLGDDGWYCLDDRCSHAEASLSEGEVWVDDGEIECPRHGSTFSLETGEALTLPATRPQRTYPVRVEDDDVIVGLP